MEIIIRIGTLCVFFSTECVKCDYNMLTSAVNSMFLCCVSSLSLSASIRFAMSTGNGLKITRHYPNRSEMPPGFTAYLTPYLPLLAPPPCTYRLRRREPSTPPTAATPTRPACDVPSTSPSWRTVFNKWRILELK